MRRSPFTLLLVATLALPERAAAEPNKRIDGATLTLGALVDVAPELADVDLGAAPPPGQSRLVSREEMLRRIQDAGLDAVSVKLPPAVRVTRSSFRLSPKELVELTRPALAGSLPKGARIVGLSASRGAVLAKGTTLAGVKLPKLPKRVGQVSVTLVAELGQEGVVTARLPLRAVLDLDAAATRPAVARGARVDVVIENGRVKVGASAVALADAELGEVSTFKVEATRKVLRARVERPDRAVVVQ